MSTAEILSLVSLISYIAAGVCLVLAVFFWFFFKIPTVMGNLSGRTAKKSIEQMRQANVRSGSKSYRSSTTNAARGKLTDAMPQTKGPAQTEDTERLENSAPAQTEDTERLENNAPEVPYYSQETTPLYAGYSAASMPDEYATTSLNVERVPVKRTGGKQLNMIDEVMLIHTNEVI